MNTNKKRTDAASVPLAKHMSAKVKSENFAQLSRT